MGDNTSVTDKNHLLINYKDISPYPIGGIEADEVAIICTGKGQIPWYSKKGHLNMADCLYSKECDGTIVTPTAVVESNKDKFQGFIIVSDCDNGTGHLKLIHRDGVSHSTYTMAQRNGFLVPYL